MKLKILILSFVLLVSASIIFASYGEQNPQWKGTIEEEDGVKVIKNPNEPLYGEIEFELEEDLSIGNEEDENYVFYRASLGEVDSDGNILVLDRGNFRVQKFDKDGKFVQSIGRQGQGPGEFERPSTLYLDSDNNIYVEDSGGKVHIFFKGGEFKNAITLTEYTRPILGEFSITKEGNLIAQTISRGERKSVNPMDIDSFSNIDLINPEGTTIKTIASFRWERSERIKTERGSTWPNSLCIPRLCLCPMNEDLAIYGYSLDYSLFAINAKGEAVYVIKKDESPQPVTKAEKKKVIDRFMEGQKKRERGPKISRNKYASALRFPKHKPFYERIIKDDKDRIYVEKFKFLFNRSDITDFDIFSKDGYYLYRAKVPVRPSVIKSGYIFKTEYDQDTGSAKIKRYKIKNWEQIRE
jgi:hypothetical protein